MAVAYLLRWRRTPSCERYMTTHSSTNETIELLDGKQVCATRTAAARTQLSS